MNGDQEALWREVEPLLDVAMLSLSSRQRELVLLRYFQSHSQRASAAVVGCSESVASRELAAAVERLRTFFARRGVSVSGPALTSLLLCYGAQATVEAGTIAASLFSATLNTGAAGASLLLTIMKATTTTKLIGAAIALLLVTTTVHYTYKHQNAERATQRTDEPIGPSNSSAKPVVQAPAPAGPLLRPAAPSVASQGNPTKPRGEYDEAALLAAREKPRKFLERINQFALMNDAEKVQRLLATEFGINLSVETIRALQARGPKGFGFGILEQWAGNQPQEALGWAAGILPERSQGGGDLQQTLLDAARRAMPGLDRASLDAMLPEGPGRSRMLDLLERKHRYGSGRNGTGDSRRDGSKSTFRTFKNAGASVDES